MPSRLEARLEEKKTETPPTDAKSIGSYKSTHSSRSSVLERAREYNRRIESQQQQSSKQQQQQRRTLSLERNHISHRNNNNSNNNNFGNYGADGLSDAGSSKVSGHSSVARRSVSAGRDRLTGPRPSTRERAMASVRKETTVSTPRVASQTTDHTHPLTPPSTATTMTQSPSHGTGQRALTHRPTTANNTSNNNHHHHHRVGTTTPTHPQQRSLRTTTASNRSPRSLQSSAPPDEDGGGGGVVTAALLVDALSGQEDGLLAIAERLMEFYDAGYDAMGEAIIDAFADVQKLFQHVVEAAHMEGAAFEASRREDEMAELRRRAAENTLGGLPDPLANADRVEEGPASPAVDRHDEFIDQDVKDVLTEAIRKGSTLRDANKFQECYALFHRACQAASSLLPVDSDHRGRLHMSMERAETLSPERACAILRYAMDNVLRSDSRAVRTPMPDPSKRADVVLSRPKVHPGMMMGMTSGVGQAGGGVIIQSSDEALANLMEEMKEVMSAPVYHDTPLQDVARRFWAALNESLKAQQKNEERLEQQLGKLKGDYLLAKAVRIR